MFGQVVGVVLYNGVCSGRFPVYIEAQTVISEDSNISNIKKINIIVFLCLNGKRYSRRNVVRKVQDFMNISIIIIVDDQNIIT